MKLKVLAATLAIPFLMACNSNVRGDGPTLEELKANAVKLDSMQVQAENEIYRAIDDCKLGPEHVEKLSEVFDKKVEASGQNALAVMNGRGTAKKIFEKWIDKCNPSASQKANVWEALINAPSGQ